MIEGQCLCGAVRFEMDEPGIVINLCECSLCRKATGSSHSSTLQLGLDRFRWVQGEDDIQTYRTRPFCRICGSRVPVVIPKAEHVSIPAGLLAGDPGCRPIGYVHSDMRPVWHEPGAYPRFFPFAKLADYLPAINAYFAATAGYSVGLRDANEADWPHVLTLANAALPHAREANDAWLEQRRAFDASTWRRCHHVGERDGIGVAYAACEEGPDARFEWCLIVPREETDFSVRNLLLQALIEDAVELGARALWVQQAADDPTAEFFREFGMQPVAERPLPGGRTAVTLEMPFE